MWRCRRSRHGARRRRPTALRPPARTRPASSPCSPPRAARPRTWRSSPAPPSPRHRHSGAQLAAPEADTVVVDKRRHRRTWPQRLAGSPASPARKPPPPPRGAQRQAPPERQRSSSPASAAEDARACGHSAPTASAIRTDRHEREPLTVARQRHAYRPSPEALTAQCDLHLDVGADKSNAYIALPEENPALGLRRSSSAAAQILLISSATSSALIQARRQHLIPDSQQRGKSYPTRADRPPQPQTVAPAAAAPGIMIETPCRCI